MRIIVCGAGRVGSQIAQALAAERHEVTVVDTDEKAIEEINEAQDLSGVTGHAAHPDILRNAGAEEADALIAATRQDEVNMVACQVAYSSFSTPRKMARIRTPEYQQAGVSLFRREHMPVDEYFFPENDIALAAANWLALPDSIEAATFLDNQVQVVGVRLGESCDVVDQALERLSSTFENLDSIVLTVRRQGKLIEIHRDTQLAIGDEVYFLAPVSQVKRTLELFLGEDSITVSRLIIVGGGNIGVRVAQEAKKQNLAAEIIEREPEVAERIRQENRDTKLSVILGDATKADIMHVAARAHAADAIVALSNHDATNLVAGGLARTKPEHRVLTLTTREELRAVAHQLGVNAVLNPAAVTVSPALSFIRSGSLEAVHGLQGGGGQIIEARVLQNSKLDGKSLAEANLPPKCRVGAILGADAELKGIGAETVLERGDRVVLFVARDDRDHRGDSLRVTGLFAAGVALF